MEEKATVECCQDPGRPLCYYLTFGAAKTGKDGGSVGEREKGKKRRERGRSHSKAASYT